MSEQIPERPKDKRTKEYKEWKEKYDNAPEGLGDIVEQFTNKTGIKKAVKAVFDDCGCDERRRKLNSSFRLKPKKCFSEHQYNEWTKFRERENKNVVTLDQQALIASILKDVYHLSIKDNCSSCSASSYKKWINMINKLYESY